MNDIEKKLLHLAKANKPNKTTFLTKEEQMYLSSQVKDVVFIGGYKNPERMRAALYGADKDIVTVMQINYPADYLTLKHQQILGTLLSLGIKREHIGDILIDQQAFVISKELSRFIKTEFTQINNVPISLEEIDLESYQHQQEYIEHRVTLDSMRLDLVVSKITKKSREEAKFSIINGEVKVNHKVIVKPTKQVEEEDVVSIRKYGRVLIDNTKGHSKKGKIVLKYKKYH
ncbi:MAG: YlmH/Sll1252 family protein [Candidatus Izemoplasmataceae bacterium]